VIGLSARTGGGGTHLVNQVEALARVPGVDVTVWAAGGIADRLIELTHARVQRHPPRGLAKRLLVEQVAGAWATRRFDVLHMVGNFALFGSRCPQAVTIQNAWLFSDDIRRFRRDSCGRLMRARLVAESAAGRASIRRAERVVAVSHTMRDLIESDLGEMEKVTVVPSAAPRPRTAGDLPPGVPDGGYVLVVAHDDPHKEWDRLIDAFTTDPRLPPLVLAGRSRAARQVDDARVRMVGQVDDPGLLAALYARASCYLAHSRFESVGITPLEALQAGTPVVATDIPAHREVCGGAARLYPPADLGQMADAVLATVADPEQRQPDGSYAHWTWDDNAARLADVLRDLATYPRPMPLKEHRRDWEDLSRLDPYWAILSEDEKQFGGWAPEEILATGEEDVDRLMARAEELGLPAQREQALDFGCGAGRLSRALSRHFESVLGLDISEQMVKTARELNADVPNCRFELNDREDLSLVPTGSVDLAFTHLVLQHLPGRKPILAYVAELVRVLRADGLLVFQLPSYIPPLRRLQPRPRLYRLLRELGVSPGVMYDRLRLQPIRMSAVPIDVMCAHLNRLGARMLDADTEPTTGGVRSTTYYVAR
jgi:glycosyltransferase involved in cell wall biosynthesis/SAM-dependent methyltransferase